MRALSKLKNLGPDERETTVMSSDADDVILIWSAQRRFITKMRRNPRFTEIGSGFHGTTECAGVRSPADQWNRRAAPSEPANH